MKYLFGTLSLLFTLTVFAQEPAVPQNCEAKNFGIENKQLTLNKDSATPYVYILHNTSAGTVILSHVQSVVGAGAEQSKLEKNKWALISVTGNSFALGCLLYQPPHVGYSDCSSVVSVCSIPSAVSLGGLWIVQNESLTKVLDTLKLRGF